MRYRNKQTGRYEINPAQYWLLWSFFLCGGVVMAIGFSGITIEQTSRDLDKYLKVSDAQAEVDLEYDWQDRVRLMVLDAGLDVSIAETIIKRESNWNPTAKLVNKNGTIDRGLWQINNVHHSEVSDECAFEPICATREAIRIQAKEGWNAWYGYRYVR